jgi:alpha-mannosidase
MAKRIDTLGNGYAVLAFNSLSWDRKDIVAVSAEGLERKIPYIAVDSDGEEMPVQIGADGVARFIGKVPSLGHSVFHIRKGRSDFPALHVSPFSMENDCVRVLFDRQGRIRKVYDKKHERDVLDPDSLGNRFIVFEDKMASTGEAWDIDIFYNDKPLETDGTFETIEVVERGPVRAALRISRTISRSRISQDIILRADSPRIDFATTVDWGNEKDVLLKVAFPVNVRSEKARYEIQFGSIERPTHWNTPWDFARFEVPAQKWADLSEGDYGVALLNDCKYGYDIRDNVMRLTLLRAPKVPGKTADVNKRHTFTYSVFPHAGDFSAGVVREAYELNVPIRAMKVINSEGDLSPRIGWMSISGSNVIVDTIKKAEDDSGIITRLYEAHGRRGRHILETSLPVKHAFETDLMENVIGELKIRNGKIAVDIKPFEIRTVKLIMTDQD